MRFTRARLCAFGYALPPLVVSSAALEERLAPVYERLKLPGGRLSLMSGIEERRFWPSGTKPSDAAALAGERALAQAGMEASEMDCLMVTSVSRDMLEPATASFVHHHLGMAQQCLVFDLSNACLGFLNGMLILAAMIETGQVRKGLIVAGETAEDLVETTLRNILADSSLNRKSIKSFFASLTIGSGAVGLVMADADVCRTGHVLVGGVCRANTAQNHLCRGGERSGSGTLMWTDSEELLKKGVETAHSTWQDFLEEIGWQPETVSRFFCHQVGRAHSRLLFETLALDPRKNFETLASLGNVGSVSAPITMAIGIEKGLLQAGERAAILGIGSGINCMMLGVEW